MSQAGSLGGGTFDFNSQAGVMALLAAVRQSALSPAQKSEMRDLVFQYANGGGDATVRRSLEQKIATYGLTPVSANATKAATTAPAPAAQPVRPFGKSRPAPQFSPVSIVGEVAVPVPPAPVPAPVATPAPAPVPAPVVEVAPAPVPAPVAQPAPAPAAAQSSALDRIREIKHAVNQKVGNPVNLVDINNVVGREYMVALLEAMKRVSGGAQGDVGEAMSRLEVAYSAVEQAIAAHAGAAAPLSQPTPAPVPAPAPVVAPTPAPVAEVPPAPAYVPPPVAEPAPAAQPTPTPAPADDRWGTTEIATPAVAPEAETAYRAPSLADDTERLLTPQDLPEASSLSTSSVSGDPLYTKEIDSGLEQLLSEWVIFKKSGLFGTGPKGREHPLFKTLAPLTITLILAGRYDGATQEIRQSITDYMNGWRYEQGIVYEQEEGFEHYLRRVIHHIIELQKRRSQA